MNDRGGRASGSGYAGSGWGLHLRLDIRPGPPACPFPGDTRVCGAYLKESSGLSEATLAGSSRRVGL